LPHAHQSGWALNSAVECHLHTVEVIGSNPIAPTIVSTPPMSWKVNRGLSVNVLSGVVFLLSCVALAQNPQLHTRAGSRFPTVVFTSVLWSADPSYYSIAIDSSGTATYQSAPDSVGKSGVPYTIEFQVSDRTRRITFNVARQLNYFADQPQAAVNSAQNGSVRTLSYHDSNFHHQMTYSSSSDSNVLELTTVFEEISVTLEFGRRLGYFHQHNVSNLDSELARLQTHTDGRSLRELPAIYSVLRSIASDPAVAAGARQKAEALLHIAVR
jgi:hypothetical protein